MNPLAMLKLKPLLEQFGARHPKFVQFFGYASNKLGEGAKLEITITGANGETGRTNIVLAPEDLELIEQLKSLLGSKSSED